GRTSRDSPAQRSGGRKGTTVVRPPTGHIRKDRQAIGEIRSERAASEAFQRLMRRSWSMWIFSRTNRTVAPSDREAQSLLSRFFHHAITALAKNHAVPAIN